MQLALNKINTFYHNWSYANQTRVIKPLQAIAANILDENANHLALSSAMRAKIREVDFTAKKNIRMLLITDSGLIQADTCLDRMKELTIKAMSNILTDEDRLVIQREIESVRAEMEHNAYQTNDKIREMIGLPQIRGHFSQIQNPNRAASDSVDQQESFKNGEFIYDPSSDQEFADYIENLKQQAKKNKSQLDAESADTLDEIWNALELMRPVNLGVNNLDVTTIDKAKIALEKVNKAKEMIAKERSLIERQVKKWVNQLDSVSIPTYSDPVAKLKNKYNLLLHTLEFNI